MDRPARSTYMDIVELRTLSPNLYRVTIAANEKVRQPPELEFGGLSTDNYARNPVVMWAHDSIGRSPSGGLPIGRTHDLRQTKDGRIVAEFEFLSEDPFAQRVKNAWDKGFLQAASISWIPLESVPSDGGGRRDVRSDLLEWSIVSVPADPEALRKSHRRMLEDFLGGSGLTVEIRPRDAGTAETPASGRGSHAAVFPEDGRAGRRHRRERLLASPDDLDDLTTALALLRGVIDAVQQSGRTADGMAESNRRRAEVSASELSELREMVGAVKNAVAPS